jgi:hypothetical protein
MEEYPCAYRTSAVISSDSEKAPKKGEEALLGDTKMSYEEETKLPCVGISRWVPLLVYQWDDLSRSGAGKLAKEDGNMSTM